MKALSPETIARLRIIAADPTLDEEPGAPSVYDYVGSNVDDAYEAGATDGEIRLARTILKELDTE